MTPPLPDRIARAALGVLACAAAAGCPDGGFDAAGSSASVTVGWTIRGELPSGPTCAALGAVRARLIVREGAGSRRDRDLEWPCDAAPASTGPVFRPVTFDLGVELVDPNDRVVAFGAWARRTLRPGGNDAGTIDLAVSAPPPDATMLAAWTLNGVPAGEAACAAMGSGAATVRLVWRVGGFEGAPFDWPCADGQGVATLGFRGGVPADFRLRLLDADGFAMTQSLWYPDRTLVPGDNSLPPIDLRVSTERAPLAVLLWWADPGDHPVYGTCEAAGVASFGYRLESSTGAVVDAAPWSTAPIACTGYVSWPSLPVDRYDLVIDGMDERGRRSWSVTCWGLSLRDAEDNTFECLVPRL